MIKSPHTLLLLYAIFLLSPLAGRSETLVAWKSLRDLETRTSERLVGTGGSRDYFFPLPVRGVEAAKVEGVIRLGTSPLLSPESLVMVRVNDLPVTAQVLSAPGEQVEIEFVVPEEAYTKDPTSDFLKLTIQASLGIPKAATRCDALAAGTLWIEIESDSGIAVTFDSENADWLSVARLPQSLQNRIVVLLPETPTAAQQDFALKLCSWLGYVSPAAEISIAEGNEPIPQRTDRFRLEPAREKGESIGIRAVGASREITLTASSTGQFANLWASLRLMDRFRLPGSSWERLAYEGGDPPASRHEQIAVGSLSPEFTSMNVGIGGMSRRFDFDLALFGERPATLRLNLGGTCKEVHRAAAATLSVFLNDYLVFTQNLEPGTTEFTHRVNLQPELLRGENRVIVALDYAPSDEECRTPLFNYFWQLDPRCSLAFEKASAVPDPESLLEAAQQFYGRNRYRVLLSSEKQLASACLAAVWLQRVNSPALIEPILATELPKSGPAMAVDMAREVAAAEGMRVPVAAREGALRFMIGKRNSFFEAGSDRSIGMIQLSYQSENRPVILVDPWGTNGSVALEAMTAQVANEPWFGGGDLVLGDGTVPPLSVTSDMLVEGQWEPPGATDRGVVNWKRWRWYIVGAIWLAVSGVILWVFGRSRANASRG